MENELRTKWIEALRSDTYHQGQGNLKNVEGMFCCLGVLCDLVDPDRWAESDDQPYFLYDGQADYPPAEILDAVGITYTEAQTLAGFNDDSGYRFADIAKYLETGEELIECHACEDGGGPNGEVCSECGR